MPTTKPIPASEAETVTDADPITDAELPTKPDFSWLLWLLGALVAKAIYFALTGH